MTKLANWERKNKEMRRAFRIIIKAFRRAGFRDEQLKNDVVGFKKPEISIILRKMNVVDVDPEIIIRHYK